MSILRLRRFRLVVFVLLAAVVAVILSISLFSGSDDAGSSLPAKHNHHHQQHHHQNENQEAKKAQEEPTEENAETTEEEPPSQESKPVSLDTCKWFASQNPNNSELRTEEWYEKFSFGEGFNSKDHSYNAGQWNTEKKLNVIIVPHSHNDPGWLLTFEQYFENQTKHILDVVVEALDEKPTRTFIWAEMSYLSLWWAQANETMRSRMRNLIVNTKQLEIVTGGWVMTDEANSFYYAMIEQMIEGHEWLRANVDASVRPRYGWSIDPFGYTPTMAYLLKRMGFDGMLIQRVHEHLKRYMKSTNQMEFKWRQNWAVSDTTDIFCHIMPYGHYDVLSSCGPDPSVCCQMDFKRLKGFYPCPGPLPEEINDSNVEHLSKMLLDQFRKKSQLYGGENNHDVIIVPFGDDFRYTDMKEAHDQYGNMEKVIAFMNAKKEYNVNVKFGTLQDYFEIAMKNNPKVNHLHGDFFTYMDPMGEYWSGYYTSRPYYKRLDRLVEYYLRSAEILFSYMNLAQSLQAKQTGKQVDKSLVNELYKQLLVARRNLGVFQHHDGITGTAKAAVVLDYQDKLMQSLKNCKNVIEQSATRLLATSDESPSKDKDTKQSIAFSIDDVQLNSSVLIDLSSSGQEQTVVIFNPSSNERNEIVSLKVNNPYLEIYDSDGAKITDYQLSLVWDNSDIVSVNEAEYASKLDPNQVPLDFDQSVYELLFQLRLAPLSTKKIRIKSLPKGEELSKKLSKVKILVQNSENLGSLPRALHEKLATMSLKEDIIGLAAKADNSSLLEVAFDADLKAFVSLQTGLLHEFESHGETFRSQVGFSIYDSYGGAYLFRPRGHAKEFNYKQHLRWIRIEHSGPLRLRICTHLTTLIHCVDFYPTLDRANELKIPAIRIWNLVDMRSASNEELVMSVASDVKSQNHFYTDLNGFQYVKRTTYLSKLPIQGNVYPMPSGAFIQDAQMRMSILTGQPLGVASMKESQLEVFLDRRLSQDDGKGLEQAMQDNRRTPSRFLLLFENVKVPVGQEPGSSLSFPSLLAQIESFHLLNPLVKLHLGKSSATGQVKNELQFAPGDKIPCDLRVLNIRTMQANAQEEPKSAEVGLILHRVVYDSCSSSFVELPKRLQDKCARIAEANSDSSKALSFKDLFKYLGDEFKLKYELKVKNTHLTMGPKLAGEVELKVSEKDSVLADLNPMDIQAFRISLN